MQHICASFRPFYIIILNLLRTWAYTSDHHDSNDASISSVGLKLGEVEFRLYHICFGLLKQELIGIGRIWSLLAVVADGVCGEWRGPW